jgi:glutathione S-transferase
MLEEQGREYDITYIDLANKPDWFLEISPSGKVPVLKVDDTPIFESAVILDYLDETASDDGRLMPNDPIARAEQRMWIAYISNVMGKGWQLQAAKDEESVRKLVSEIRGHFEELTKNLSGDGPLWGGQTFTMVDVAIAPILQRFTWAETLEPTLGLFDGLEKMTKWRDKLLARDATKASIVPNLEDKSAQMLHSMGSWVARGVEA